MESTPFCEAQPAGIELKPTLKAAKSRDSIIKTLMPSSSKPTADEILREFDKDGNGVLDQEEARELAESYLRKRGRITRLRTGLALGTCTSLLFFGAIFGLVAGAVLWRYKSVCLSVHGRAGSPYHHPHVTPKI